jgi:predicted dehydrogenase
MATTPPPERCVIAGGGRWARVVLRELLGVLPPATAIVLASPSAAEVMRDFVARDDVVRPHAGRIEVRRDLPAAAASPGDVAVVVKKPAQHYEAAAALLERGYHVLVEKPFTLEPDHARALLALARERGRVAAAGLVFLAAEYLHEFRRRLPFDPASAEAIDIQWSDPEAEIRYGEVKRVAGGVSIVMEVLPHAWSLLVAVFGREAPLAFRLASAAPGRRAAAIAGSASGVPLRVDLDCAASHRRRTMTLRSAAGEASLDFAGDPVIARIGGAMPASLPVLGAEGRPMARMLRGFLDYVRRRDENAAWARGIVTGPAIPAHIDLLCGVERAFSAR